MMKAPEMLMMEVVLETKGKVLTLKKMVLERRRKMELAQSRTL